MSVAAVRVSKNLSEYSTLTWISTLRYHKEVVETGGR